MAFPENQQHIPNPAPPSLSAGDHEMRDYYAAQDAPRPSPQNEPYLTPYLGLRARLSQTWINRWTILLLLVLIRTLFAIASIDNNLGSARREALGMCKSVEDVGSAMASMPHYMSSGVNQLSAAGIEKAINGLMEMLILSITGIEEIIVFFINLMTQTYLCLITLVVSGSLHVAVSVAKDVGDFLNSTAQDVGKELGEAAGDFEKAMNGFMSGLNDVGNFFTGDNEKPPKINLDGEIEKLNNLDLPAGYDQGLDKLNASIPTFEQVNNFTQTALRLPFEEVKKLLKQALPTYKMNGELFPVPLKEQLSFCSDDDGINHFFDNLVDIEQLAKKVFLGVIIALAILVMIPMAWREYKRWKFMQETSQLVKSDAFDSMDAVYIASRPYTARAGLKMSERVKSPRRRTLLRWAVAYCTTVPALFVLSLGIAGLLACGCQYILLKQIEKEVPNLENQVIGFADKVSAQLNNASEQWAIGSNKIITDLNTEINHDVFGWVNTTTHAINNTLNVFVDETTDVLKTTFGDTILYDAIMDVLNCLILLKIEGIQRGLTWVSDHAHIDFPLLPKDTLSLGTIQKVSGDKADILAAGDDGSAADAVTAAVYHVTDFIYSGIKQEAIISFCVVLIWVIIAMIGFGTALVLMIKGGDDGVWHGAHPTTAGGPQPEGGEKYEMSHLPPYEQATRTDPGDNSANRYYGQAYTLSPNPMPGLAATSATSPILRNGFAQQSDEKLGTVAGQNVENAVRRPTHIRASSHGDYHVASPATATAPHDNPFERTSYYLQPPADDKHNPFRDPYR